MPRSDRSAYDRKSDSFDIEHDLGDVLFNAGNGRELMLDTVNACTRRHGRSWER